MPHGSLQEGGAERKGGVTAGTESLRRCPWRGAGRCLWEVERCELLTAASGGRGKIGVVWSPRRGGRARTGTVRHHARRARTGRCSPAAQPAPGPDPCLPRESIHDRPASSGRVRKRRPRRSPELQLKEANIALEAGVGDTLRRRCPPGGQRGPPPPPPGPPAHQLLQGLDSQRWPVTADEGSCWAAFVT